LGVDGLHFHVLCESSSFSLEKAIEQLELRFGHLLNKVKWVNMGGGHLMTRNDYDTAHLIKVLKAFKEKHGVEVILEPGSAFAWQTGILRSKVLDIVENGGVKTAILDVSFTAHMPDTLEMPYRPNVLGATEAGSESKHLYRLGGVSCLAGDYMEVYNFERELQIGDDIILEDMIHYTMVKTTMFNGVKHPDIGILKTDGTYQVVRAFSYSDFKGRLS
nr:carboxynorspermidine decarboxylase [Prolixibacteraceae bacterium]